MATARRKYFHVADSVADEPWSNDDLAALVRLMARMNTRWARNNLTPEEACRIRLGPTEVMAISGKRRADVAATSLRRLADVASMSVRLDGHIVEIEWPNFAEYQGFAARARPQRRPSASVTASVTATASAEEKKAPATPTPSASRSKGKSACPSELDPEAKERIRRWASENGVPVEHLGRAWAAFFDWAKSESKRKADWEAAFRNALRSGWVLPGRNGGGPDGESPAQARVRRTIEAARKVEAAIGRDPFRALAASAGKGVIQ